MLVPKDLKYETLITVFTGLGVKINMRSKVKGLLGQRAEVTADHVCTQGSETESCKVPPLFLSILRIPAFSTP